MLLSLSAVITLVAFVLLAIVIISLRTVVSTNEVHIVQSTKTTVSYGKDLKAGNTYYKWPSWLPIWGIKTTTLPMSVFNVALNAYAAYDKGRVPFIIDVMAFFRVTDPNVAAQRVSSYKELQMQLQSILQGAIRTILASSEIEEILEGRGKFGEMFTKEVDQQLREWGIQSVKCIELMDIRDDNQSHVIENIMAKKKSRIEMQSRMEVAENLQKAKEKEIEAQREVALKEQQALEQVGIRTAEKDKAVGITREKATQEVKTQAALTAERDMAVQQVQRVRTAEIQREVVVVTAEQEKRKAVIDAEGEAAAAIAAAEGQKRRDVILAEGKAAAAIAEAQGQKQQTVLVAEGDLAKALKHAEGVQAEGLAKGEAEKALQLASVTAQTTLAEKIGENKGYQEYLLGIKRVEAGQAVGIAQAAALQAAEIKVIANTGDVSSGVNSLMDLLTPKGGTQLGAMIDGFVNTEAGAKVMAALDKTTPEKSGSNGAAKH